MDFNFKYPTLDLQYLLHKSSDSNGKEALRKHLLDNSMYSVYQSCISKNILQDNKQDLKTIQTTKQEKLNHLLELKDKDPENISYIKSLDIQIAELFAQFLDTEEALEIFKNILKDESSFSLQMDIYLCRIRIGMLIKNKKLVEENVNLANDCCELGCDWDRRNKFKIYKAIYNLKKGDFNSAAFLFSESLPSFEKNEVVDFKNAVNYLIFSGLLTFERSNIKKLLLECPEVLEIGSVESIQLIKSMYECNYYEFLPNLYKYLMTVKDDFYCQNFVDFFCKEMKIKIYKQLLDSYQSIDLRNMANLFGIQADYLENDLGTYIVEKRLNCKIDRISYTIVVQEEEYDGLKNVIVNGSNLIKTIYNNIQ
ncbi:proteasome subunit RPN7 (RPN7) [Vairimorpha necatrix]|uniref:Proteasome subunit RPN7 (RPN7) n=1 Tax=Vairimorpha necatrix TaxID=6039 RepID=A0AAX4JEK5_9MICR